MNYVFSFFILAGILMAAINGRIDVIIGAAMTSAGNAVQRAVSLIGVVSLWLGIARVAEKSGLIDMMSRLIALSSGGFFRPFLKGTLHWDVF